MINYTDFPRGSEWRKWDLHVHTKGTNKNDQFNSATFEEFCVILFRKALENEIAAIGITDYFNIDNYKKVNEFINSIDSSTDFSTEEKEKIKGIFILPNVELRMLPVTDSGRLVNIHCIFNPSFVDSLENDFFALIKHSGDEGKDYLMNKKGIIDLGKSLDSSLKDEAAYKKGIDNFVVYHGDLKKLLEKNYNFRENVIVVVSNSSQDGASGFQKHYDLFEDSDSGSLDAVRKSIYCISQAVFSGNVEDIKYFVGKKKDNEDEVKNKCGSLKPCIHGSDAHNEGKLFLPDKDRFCWIKADLSFEGLKQIIYEPESGERVKISPIEPDQKDDYKVISNIQFSETSDFPEEIKFNRNLCSIIGSRSSGKSALLAYIAHSVDPELAERMKVDGPGEGADFSWEKINESDLEYSIEWSNGQSNKENAGNIVYVRQNYLFEKSKDSDEIKEKINPVLFRILPEFEVKYKQAKKNIELHNQRILEQVDIYFELSNSIKVIDEKLKDLGNKNAIEKEKKGVEIKIKSIKEKNHLSDKELKKYQEISSTLSTIASRIEEINTELTQISEVSEDQGFFSEIKITLSPALENLPTALQFAIIEELEKNEGEILKKINKQVFEYNKAIEKDRKVAEKKIKAINKQNKILIKKYQKNEEIQVLVSKLTKFNGILDKIKDTNKTKKIINDRIEKCVNKSKLEIDQRSDIIKELKTTIDKSDQSSIKNIKFLLEYGFNANLDDLMKKINIKRKSKFIENDLLKINDIRENPGEYLLALFSGKQKVISGYNSKEVAKDTLSLTEKILFTAEMEGDKIGGFSEPTMTPGKRALFLLRLVLAESDETWPLLIDQPEDDLDSRSIYNDIVPFLKEKKKERQIIMVSHDANLVIGSDSEQVIVANRDGTDRKNIDGLQFNYLTGSLEYTKPKDETCKDTLKSRGVREHACEILDGGKTAFENRKNKYNIT